MMLVMDVLWMRAATDVMMDARRLVMVVMVMVIDHVGEGEDDHRR